MDRHPCQHNFILHCFICLTNYRSFFIAHNLLVLWGNFAEATKIWFGFLFFPVAYIISCQDARVLWPSSGYGGHPSQHLTYWNLLVKSISVFNILLLFMLPKYFWGWLVFGTSKYWSLSEINLPRSFADILFGLAYYTRVVLC
jgi:hypothetical protein